MPLSKKNYIAFAEILRDTSASADTIRQLADYFEGDNPNFDRNLFIEACLPVYED